MENQCVVRKRRRRQAGMTLIEIMIVIVIIGLVGTGVTVAYMSQLDSANEKTARTEACNIRNAVILYIAQNPGSCPSIDELKGGYLDAQKRTNDPWNQPYNIDCSDGDINVYSGGKDGSGRIACGEERE